jgi:hypothetical protein
MRAIKRLAAVSALILCLVWGVPALAAVAPQAGTFSGGTSQPEGTVGFTVPDAADAVLEFEAGLYANCVKSGADDHTVGVDLTPAPSIDVKDGSFNYSGGFSFYSESKPLGHGQGTVHGSFTSDRVASGTMSFPWDFSAGPLNGYHCDTGVISFQATAAPPATPSPPPPSAPPPAVPPQCVVPSLKSKKLKAARRIVHDTECKLGVVKRRSSSNVAARRVIAQKPPAGVEADVDTPIKLIVSSGQPR